MIELADIEGRCTGLAGPLHHAVLDQITLLRMARRIKTVHGYLQTELSACIREEGWTSEVAALDASIGSIEQDLRRVLLDYHRLQTSQMHECLRHAVDTALDVLETFLARQRRRLKAS